MHSSLPLILSLPALILATSSPLICEEPIDGKSPYNSNTIPCILTCHNAVTVPTGTLLPGMINSTAIPYCYLDCVHENATPAQSALAPECSATCENGKSDNPEELGWCVYWCVDGYKDFVAATSCVPHLSYTTVTTAIAGTTETVLLLTEPALWSSWYATETVLPKTTTAVTTVDDDDDNETQSATSTSSNTTTSTLTTTSATTDSSSSTSTTGTRQEIFPNATAAAETAKATNKDSRGNSLYPSVLGLVVCLGMIIVL